MDINKQNAIQFRLWENCENGCTFCSSDPKYISSIEERRENILKVTEFIKEGKADQYNIIGLIGGEFFQGQLKGIEKEWDELIDSIKTPYIWIYATLIERSQYYLKDTIRKIEDPERLLLCSSWDPQGRFKTEGHYSRWRYNIENFISSNFKVHVTSILTKALVEHPNPKEMIPKGCKWSWIEPCCYNIQFYHHPEQFHLYQLPPGLERPTRKDTINFFKKNIDVLPVYSNVRSHSNDIVDFSDKYSMIEIFKDRYNPEALVNNPVCGHPIYSKVYSDSSACAMCDALEILDSV